MERIVPGTIIQLSDRRYIVNYRGEWRLLDYQPKPVEVVPQVTQEIACDTCSISPVN